MMDRRIWFRAAAEAIPDTIAMDEDEDLEDEDWDDEDEWDDEEDEEWDEDEDEWDDWEDDDDDLDSRRTAPPLWNRFVSC